MKHNKNIIAVVILFILILLAITNPSVNDYREWKKSNMELADYIKASSYPMERKDYIFFCVYISQEKIIAIGILKNHFKIN